MKFTDININTPEGKYLLAAVSLLTSKYGPSQKTPESVMDELKPIADNVDDRPRDFEKELRGLINSLSLEAESDTPDFILASYIVGSLENFDRCVRNRSNWYGNNYETPSLKEFYKAPTYNQHLKDSLEYLTGKYPTIGTDIGFDQTSLEARQAAWDRQYDSRDSEPVKSRPARPSLETDAYAEKLNQPLDAFKQRIANFESDESKEARVKELRKQLEINKSGYAGVNRMGQIVDRRKDPAAVPIPENSLLGVPAPKPWPEAGESQEGGAE